MLELVSSIECKDAHATVPFVLVAAAVLSMLLVTTPVLWLLETVSELVDFCCKGPDFFFSCEEATLLVAMSYCDDAVERLKFSREGDERQRCPTERARNL
uniref:Uncharacterized protein n=1 Tax=Opuntia streptacantha TaxID=393608 RepID=A0A7C9AC29_OPUST